MIRSSIEKGLCCLGVKRAKDVSGLVDCEYEINIDQISAFTSSYVESKNSMTIKNVIFTPYSMSLLEIKLCINRMQLCSFRSLNNHNTNPFQEPLT